MCLVLVNEPGECLGRNVLLLGVCSQDPSRSAWRLAQLAPSSLRIREGRPDSWVRAPTHPHMYSTVSTDAEDVFWTEQGELTFQQEMDSKP